MNLPLLDGVMVLVLLAGLIGVGFWSRRFSKTVANFTVAGREVGVWLGLSASVAQGVGLISIGYNEAVVLKICNSGAVTIMIKCGKAPYRTY